MKLSESQVGRVLCFLLHFPKYQVRTVSWAEWLKGTTNRFWCPTCDTERCVGTRPTNDEADNGGVA